MRVNRWLLRQARKKGLRVCFVRLGDDVVSDESHGLIFESINNHDW